MVKPYGSWKSPITSELIVSETIKLGQIVLDGDYIYWSESHPEEGGRSVILRCSRNDSAENLTSAPFNVRTRVHEYGGGAFTVSDSIIYFANFADQRLYLQPLGLEPQPVTPPEVALRYADIVVDEEISMGNMLSRQIVDYLKDDSGTVMACRLGGQIPDLIDDMRPSPGS